MSDAPERKEFESFFSGLPFEMDVRRFPDDETVYGWPGQYVDVRTQLAWESWNRRADLARLSDDLVSEMRLCADYDRPLDPWRLIRRVLAWHERQEKGE
jgi:hypothetical protein